ncbi:hypothetical protein BC628DRAFT_1373422 [Trametes gibbosa]|nr:hypothetical protein BC628DRAFT_1373422 [Trametes gibbosa]
MCGQTQTQTQKQKQTQMRNEAAVPVSARPPRTCGIERTRGETWVWAWVWVCRTPPPLPQDLIERTEGRRDGRR